MRVREQLEELESQTLSPFASFARSSRGRERTEEECPVRTAYQRDRDRIIHCKAFRRLKGKTQVYPNPTGDHYRTRLTHTLEVSQIARTLACGLRLNENLAEAIALGHDLGHTPFGHAGAFALDEAIRQVLPERHFLHQEQSLRVVDLLEGLLQADGSEQVGLNLTWEVRDGILYHSKGEDDLDLAGPSTLEGRLVRLADRLACLSHDTDDALRAGTLQPEDLPDRRLFGFGASQLIDVVVQDVIERSRDQGDILLGEELTAKLDALNDFLFRQVYRDPIAKREENRAGRMVQLLFRSYLENPELLGLDPSEDLPTREQAATDYVAGMTDRFAAQAFSDLFLPEPWEG
ncbi:MAG: deoxyguanosinetriphosphate triphosphohydrolase [Coprothermobacterota bacterium]|nr:deoxyguanosinetriphosphate triphosphohydrolase [Coprothermobacterota bacterium]